jgi:hypothetical protein
MPKHTAAKRAANKILASNKKANAAQRKRRAEGDPLLKKARAQLNKNKKK